MNLFKTLTLKKVEATETFFEIREYSSLFESTTTESATFTCKTILWKGNVKTNCIRNTKWTYYKEQSFATSFFVYFWKFNLSIRTTYKELIWTKYPYSYFRKCWGFIWESVSLGITFDQMCICLNLVNCIKKRSLFFQYSENSERKHQS